MNRTLASGALLSVALACSAPPPKAAATPAATNAAPVVTPEELTAPVRHLELGELTLNRNAEPGLVLHADGTVEAPGGGPLGQLGQDGRFLERGGRVVAELTADGEILDANGEYLPVVIEGARVKLLKENRVIELTDEGTLVGANPGGPVVTITGVTPKTRRTALFLLVLSAYPARSGS
jgi:hypothetical protein